MSASETGSFLGLDWVAIDETTVAGRLLVRAPHSGEHLGSDVLTEIDLGTRTRLSQHTRAELVRRLNGPSPASVPKTGSVGCPVCGLHTTWHTRVGPSQVDRTYAGCGHTIHWDFEQDRQP